MSETKTTDERTVVEFAVSPRVAPTAIMHGLRAAGIKASKGKMWTGGKYPIALDLAIDIDCPWGHLSRDKMTFGKVRLLVDPHALTMTVLRDDEQRNGCPQCDQTTIDRWLGTCRGHVENRHPDHNIGWIEEPDFEGTSSEVADLVMGDEWPFRYDDSPIGHVFRALGEAEREASDREKVTHPEAVADSLRSVAKQNGQVPDEEWIEETVARQIEKAKARLSTGTKYAGDSAVEIVPKHTVESVAEWLAEQGVPLTAGQNAAWDLVKNLPGCPTQALVRDAQAKRKQG